jgi:hypothetical protein
MCSQTHTLTAKEIKKEDIDTGLEYLPELFYASYYEYPENISELLSFCENHYEYMYNTEEFWKTTVKYLKQNKKKINIISNIQNLFAIFYKNQIVYNNNDICEIIALRRNRYYFHKFASCINIYDNNGRNLQEIIGFEKSDSITIIFQQKRKELHAGLDTINYVLELTPYGTEDFLDKRRWAVFEYSLGNGLQPFCNEDNLELTDNDYFTQLENICKQFCEEQNITRMIFCNIVVRKKHESIF